MESLVPISVWIVLGLVGLSFLAMGAFGLRSLIQGKVSPIVIGIVLVPVLLMLGLGFGLGDWSQAGVYTFLVMLVLAALSLLLSGVRGLFT